MKIAIRPTDQVTLPAVVSQAVAERAMRDCFADAVVDLSDGNIMRCDDEPCRIYGGVRVSTERRDRIFM